MTELDQTHLENRLLEERKRTLDSIQTAEAEEREGQRESAGELSRAPQHQADAASDTQEAEKDFANVNRESGQIALIDTALRRLREDPEGYRTCDDCGDEIAAERFDVVPWARLCASCARRAEEDPAVERVGEAPS